MKNVGVPFTPLRTPWRKSSRTRLVQVPVSISTNALKAMMVAKLGDPTAPFMGQLFESIAHAFEQTYNTWKTSCLVTFQGGGAVATMMTPVPVPGPVAGVAAMAPGGLA